MGDKEKNDNGFKNYAKFSGITIQMGATIFAGAYFGKWLDEKYPAEKKWFTMLFTLLAVALALFNIIRQLNKHNNQEKNND